MLRCFDFGSQSPPSQIIFCQGRNGSITANGQQDLSLGQTSNPSRRWAKASGERSFLCASHRVQLQVAQRRTRGLWALWAVRTTWALIVTILWDGCGYSFFYCFFRRMDVADIGMLPSWCYNLAQATTTPRVKRVVSSRLLAAQQWCLLVLHPYMFRFAPIYSSSAHQHNITLI